jgi:hypothetical protein
MVRLARCGMRARYMRAGSATARAALSMNGADVSVPDGDDCASSSYRKRNGVGLGAAVTRGAARSSLSMSMSHCARPR